METKNKQALVYDQDMIVYALDCISKITVSGENVDALFNAKNALRHPVAQKDLSEFVDIESSEETKA